MYAHDNSHHRQTVQDHAADAQVFDVLNGRETLICGLCCGLVVRWVTEHGTGLVHA